MKDGTGNALRKAASGKFDCGDVAFIVLLPNQVRHVTET